jgi:hypothetical protein
MEIKTLILHRRRRIVRKIIAEKTKKAIKISKEERYRGYSKTRHIRSFTF